MPITFRRRLALGVTMLAVAAPAAQAETLPPPTTTTAPLAWPFAGYLPPSFPGPCGIDNAQLQGDTGGTNNQVCMGAGLAFIGPSIGQVATVIGPTIIGPAVVGSINVGAGNIAG